MARAKKRSVGVKSCECFFLDVGSASSAVVLLGGRRAIVIDAARSSKIPLTLLQRYVDTIELFAISHNDIDHDGGAAEIIGVYSRKIRKIACLSDRESRKPCRTLNACCMEIRKNRLRKDQVVRLECSGRGTTPLFHDPNTRLRVDVLAPDFMANVEALRKRSSNGTSGVLMLSLGRSRIVFPGDATADVWGDIAERSGQLKCHVLAVPHHGGSLRGSATVVYGDFVKAKTAVVSVGTSNQHGHPRPDVIHALLESQANVMCTQITDQCYSSQHMENLRPGVLGPLTPSPEHEILRYRSSSATTVLTAMGRSRDLACAGTVVAKVTARKTQITVEALHSQAVDDLDTHPHGTPLCRK